MRRKAITATFALLFMGAACGGGGPTTQETDVIIPELRVPTAGAVRGIPLSSDSTSVEADEEAGECLEWVFEEESYNPGTGVFSSRYSCPAGGEIAAIVTEGVDDGAGNGTYTTTYLLRDGGEVVWEYTYELAEDGLTQTYAGSSNEEESFAGVYTWSESGRTEVHEVWNLVEGSYRVDGFYEADDRFNGTSVFDDPATEASPDWTLEHHEGLDGAISQEVSGLFEGWQSDYTYILQADGASTYVFTHDDLGTEVIPDFDGAYSYQADGAGEGSYRQRFDDGSTLDVVDVFDALGNVVETWSFDDAGTTIEVDQEGEMSYAPDGSGAGTVTFLFEDGSSERCALSLDVDGTSTVSDCS